MDAIGALGLVSNVASLIRSLYAIARGIEEITRNWQNADRNILRLAGSITNFETIIEELQRWLQSRPTLSAKFSNTITNSINASQVIVDDIEETVNKIKPVEGDTAARFMQKVRLMWNDAAIKDHERMLSNQMQQFHLIIYLRTENDRNPGVVDTLVDRPENQEKLSKAQDDARTIRMSRRAGTVTTSSFTDRGDNFSVVLDVDEELAMTGPYQRQLRHLLSRQFGQRSTSQLPAELEATPSVLDRQMNTMTLQPSVFSIRSVDTYEAAGSSHISSQWPDTVSGASYVSSQWPDTDLGSSYVSSERPETIVPSPAATLVPQEILLEQLCEAIEGGNVETVRNLVDGGTPLNEYGPTGYTPLGLAIKANRLNVVQLLLSKQVNVEHGERTGGWRPLHMAVNMGSANITLELLRKGAMVHTELPGGMQAIHTAAAKGFTGVLRHLIEYDANWNAQYQSKDTSGITPLHLAHGSVVDTLITVGANPTLVDSKGCLPIHYAARRGDSEAVRKFIQRGVSVNVRDNNRYTPLMYTCYADAEPQQLEQLMNLLLQHRSDLPPADFLHRVLTSSNPNFKSTATAARVFNGAGYDLNHKARYNYLPSSLNHIPAAEWRVTLLGQLCCSLRKFADKAITSYTRVVTTLINLNVELDVPPNSSSATRQLSPLNLLVESLIFYEQPEDGVDPSSADFIIPSNDVPAFLTIACALIRAGADYNWIRRNLTGPPSSLQQQGEWNRRESSADARELLVDQLFECFARGVGNPTTTTGGGHRRGHSSSSSSSRHGILVSSWLRQSLVSFQSTPRYRQSFHPFQMELKRIIAALPDDL